MIVDSLTYEENYVLVYELDDYNQTRKKIKRGEGTFLMLIVVALHI